MKIAKRFLLPLLCSLLIFTQLFSSEDETLAIRRIATCYYEKDFSLLKRLSQDFLNAFPESEHIDNLYLLIGDMYSQESKWEQAYTAYQMIEEPSLAKEAFTSTLHCLYSLKHFDTLKELIEKEYSQAPLFSKTPPIVVFYHTEALFKGRFDSLEKNEIQHIEDSYKKLLKTPFKPHAHLALAHLYTLQESHSKASVHFSKAAPFFPDLNEKLLFQAACHQTHFDPKLAAKTFYQIKNLDLSRSQEAFYHWMTLLFHSNNYEGLLSAQKEIFEKIPEDKLAAAHLMMGKVFFAKKNYEEALLHFQKGNHLLEEKSQKESLFLTLLCSYHLNNHSLFNRTLSKLEKAFKGTYEHQKALFLKGKRLQKNKTYQKAQPYFSKVIKYGHTDLAAAAQYEYALCSFLNHQYQNARDHFLKVIKNFPQCAYENPATSYLLQSSAHLMTEKATDEMKQQLLNDYLLCLKNDSFFATEELPEIHLKIAKLYFDLQNFERLRPFLESFLNTFPDYSKAYQAHLLLALSYEPVGESLAPYISHLEKALQYELQAKDKTPILLHLFHATYRIAQYQSLQEIPVENQLMQAGSYLSEAVRYGALIPKKHFYWLAHLYTETLDPLDPSSLPLIEKASETLQALFQAYPESCSEHDLELKFKYAQILGWQDKEQEKIKTLQFLEKKAPPSSVLYNKALLELACCYEKQGRLALARENYESIVSNYNIAIPHITQKAKLHLARILCQDYLKSGCSQEPSPKIATFYKDLQTQRSLKNEPVHLEAALDYCLFVHAKSILNGDYQPYLEALLQVRQDFTNQDTLVAKEYHEMRKLDPNLNLLYEAYMQFLDVRILHIQAKQHLTYHKPIQAREKWTLAKKQIDRMLEINCLKTPYLDQAITLEQKTLQGQLWTSEHLTSYFTRGDGDGS